VRGAELDELLLHELALVARAAVLEPDGHLLGVQAHLGGEPHLARRLQLPLLPEAHLQEPRLLVAQAPLLRLVVPGIRRRLRLPAPPLPHLLLLPACQQPEAQEPNPYISTDALSSAPNLVQPTHARSIAGFGKKKHMRMKK
jgi:hypothetical protein